MLNSQQLRNLLNDHRGANFVTVETQTVPKLLAHNPLTGELNPFRGNVVKVSTVNGTINWVYERSVNRQRTREDLTPDFQAFPRKWGQRHWGTPFVEHKGQWYLELKVERCLGYHYETLDGQPLDKDAVNAFLSPSYPTRQGVENEIILRDYKVENIRNIKFRGNEYRVAA